MNDLSRLLIALALAGALAQPGHALFGKGKKDAADAPKEDAQKLPGMPGADDQKAAPASGEDKKAAPSSDAQGQQAPTIQDATRPDDAKAPAAADAKDAAPKTVTPAAGSSLPTEVVIKGGDGASKLSTQKPPLRIDADAFESIRSALKPDEALLLAESPLTIAWRRTHPEFLMNSRVIEPWRTTFSERPGIGFYPREQLYEVMGRQLDPKEIKNFQWQLTIADEEGRVFQHWEGSNNPPEELVWSGQNDQNEWIKAGRSYSPIFMFTDPGGSPHTKVGKTLQFTGVIHQESDGLHISLDSTVLFGSAKGARAIEKGGGGLVRSAADLIKRRFTGIPVRVEAFSSTKELGDSQAKLVEESLTQELMLLSQNISSEGASAPFAEQRVEVVLLNR